MGHRTTERSGAVVLRNANVQTVQRLKDRWRVRVSYDGTVKEPEANYLIDATGRSHWVGRRCGSRWRCADELIGIVGLLHRNAASPPLAPVLLLESVEDGWWYSAPLPDNRFVLAFMTDRDYLTNNDLPIADFWKQQLLHTRHQVERIGPRYQADGDLRVIRADTGRTDRLHGAGWAAVGEAAVTYDPLSGTGLYKAMRSGLQIVQSLAQKWNGRHDALDEYASNVVGDFERSLHHRAEYYAMEKRWPQSRFWSRRQGEPRTSTEQDIRSGPDRWDRVRLGVGAAT